MPQALVNNLAPSFLANYNQQAGGILGGYAQLANQVGGTLVGSNRSQLNDIYSQYIQQRAIQNQDRISRGLSNSSKRYTDSSSLLGAKWRAEAVANDSLANRMASYGAQIGLAGLGAAGGFLNAGSQLGFNYYNLFANTVSRDADRAAAHPFVNPGVIPGYAYR